MKTKTAAKHTPGPWHIHENCATFGVIGSPSGSVINGDGFAIKEREEKECEANARLIVASPELLLACQKAVYFMKYEDGSHDRSLVLSLLQSAIVLAGGISP